MMKRNILAVVIPALLAAGAANAAEVYNKDGNKLDLYGKVDARHQFSDNAGDDGDQTYVRFGFKGSRRISKLARCWPIASARRYRLGWMSIPISWASP